ncbi:hypothetical protein RND71_043726 [Anisodus tanguticus]|uniref:Uncharacterized protein n=1 Tax=Anisodus tanguticus TaxID=243964 RepID=A0AAE1QP74_9SOLA|nr:hypothetical protein RND71_043726 [Anisodus tanguticus]
MADYCDKLHNQSATYTLQRHREILNDYNNEFKKTRSNIASQLEREQLINSKIKGRLYSKLQLKKIEELKETGFLGSNKRDASFNNSLLNLDDCDMTSENDKKTNENSQDGWAKDLKGLESLANFDFNNTQNVSSTSETNQESLSKTLLDCLGDFPCSNKRNEDSDKELVGSDEDDYETDSSSNSSENEESKNDKDSKVIEKKTVNKEKKKKKRKAFGTRRNIKKLLTDHDLDEKILNARLAEEERINRIIEQQQATKKIIQNNLEKSNFTEDIILSSDDEVQIIELTDEDFSKENEECNSGLHVDDSLNVPNSDGQVLINVGHPKDDEDFNNMVPSTSKSLTPEVISLIDED